jgi:hypothetical protein
MASDRIPLHTLTQLSTPAILNTKLFHVTACEAVDSILAHGLRANDYGQIFAIDSELVAEDVARGQLFLSSYALFWINARGISGAIEADNVAELVAGHHRIIVQQLIPPEFLILLARKRNISSGYSPFRRQWFARLGVPKEEIDEMERMQRTVRAHNEKAMRAHDAKAERK